MMSSATAAALPQALDAEACWARLVEPARVAPDFFYGVSTTRVVCRPGCPSRRPLRRNVRFFAALGEALDAGFRPCKRCRPEAATGPAAARAAQAATRAGRLIDDALAAGEAAPSLAALAAAVHLSPFYFQRLFKRLLGVSPAQYARGRKQGRLVAALAQGDAVAGALYEAGFGASASAYRAVTGAVGATPGRLAVADLRYGLVATVLGRALVAATEAGVAALFLGDDDAALIAELGQRFPRAGLLRDEAALAAVLGVIAELAAAPARAAADLPLDLRGTAFEIAVWQALRAIPPGETRSYGQLAAALGKPGAARAVGRACGANPVSLLVPCHRAVGADGALTGYRWGTARKRALLAAEGATK